MMAELLAPLHPLLSTKNEFICSESKGTPYNYTTVGIFGVTKPARLYKNASRQGLGFVMYQQVAEGLDPVASQTQCHDMQLQSWNYSQSCGPCSVFLTGLLCFETTVHLF